MSLQEKVHLQELKEKLHKDLIELDSLKKELDSLKYDIDYQNKCYNLTVGATSRVHSDWYSQWYRYDGNLRARLEKEYAIKIKEYNDKLSIYNNGATEYYKLKANLKT